MELNHPDYAYVTVKMNTYYPIIFI